MDLETFKQTVIPLRAKLLNFCTKLTNEGEDAEDIVQETFLKLWYIRDKLDGYRSVEALSVQIAKNICMDYFRTKKPQGPTLDTLTGLSSGSDTEQLVEERELVDKVKSLIKALPSLQQTIIRMKDVEGYELNEIAGITGTQIEAVRTNLSRARKKIREQLLNLNR